MNKNIQLNLSYVEKLEDVEPGHQYVAFNAAYGITSHLGVSETSDFGIVKKFFAKGIYKVTQLPPKPDGEPYSVKLRDRDLK